MKKLLLMFVALAILLCGCAGKANKTDWDYIQSKGEIIIGITYFSPMNYLDENGVLTGFETEFAQAVCNELGIKPIFQEIDWSTKEIELAAKNIDAIWNGMTATPSRAAEMDLSRSYLNNRPVMIVRDDHLESLRTPDDLRGAIVVAENGSHADGIIQEDPFFEQATYVAVDTQIKGFMEIAAGTADLTVCDYVMSIGSLGAGTDFASLVVSPYWDYEPEEYAIAFRKGSPQTLEKVNSVIIKLLENGTLERIATKYKLNDLLIK